MKPWYVYIAQASTGRYYTGITVDPSARLQMHNLGEGSRFALQQGPFSLIYISSAFDSKEEARKRETRVKDWSRYKKEKLITGDWNLL